jgi:hypothetical protein
MELFPELFGSGRALKPLNTAKRGLIDRSFLLLTIVADDLTLNGIIAASVRAREHAHSKRM